MQVTSNVIFITFREWNSRPGRRVQHRISGVWRYQGGIFMLHETELDSRTLDAWGWMARVATTRESRGIFGNLRNRFQNNDTARITQRYSLSLSLAFYATVSLSPVPRGIAQLT